MRKTKTKIKINNKTKNKYFHIQLSPKKQYSLKLYIKYYTVKNCIMSINMEKLIKKQLFEFSKIIKELRLQYKYTQKYVAIKLNISYQSYQAYELGITVPTLQNFLKLALLYDVSLDYLIDQKKY